MKKTVIFIVLVLALFLVGCAKKATETTDTQQQQQPVPQQQDNLEGTPVEEVDEGIDEVAEEESDDLDELGSLLDDL